VEWGGLGDVGVGWVGWSGGGIITHITVLPTYLRNAIQRSCPWIHVTVFLLLGPMVFYGVPMVYRTT
jgi:hypothetical protein